MCQIPKELISRMKNVRRVVISTGAGVSAESGVPTFRGDGGIWEKMSAQELASVDGFLKNPDLVWEWYQHRREIRNQVKPNRGHDAIAKLEKMYDYFTLITQNIDGLHFQAGSQNILELHGNISRNKCLDCQANYEPEISIEEGLPRCDCGGMIRPDVVWFGEMLPEEVLEKAFADSEACELFFSVGTSAIVQPAASLPMVASRTGAYVVEINIEETPLTTSVDLFLRGKSGELLPQILDELSIQSA